MIVKRHRKPVPQMNAKAASTSRKRGSTSRTSHLIDPETGKPTRVKYEVRDGKKVRVAKSGKVIPETAYGKETAEAKR